MGEGQVTLHLPPGSWVDVEVFEAHCQRGEWEEALSLYGGEFLPEYRYADWTVAPRERLALLYQRALLEAARARLSAGRFGGALEACWRLLSLEPWHEEAVLLGMRACVALNDLPVGSTWRWKKRCGRIWALPPRENFRTFTAP